MLLIKCLPKYLAQLAALILRRCRYDLREPLLKERELLVRHFLVSIDSQTRSDLRILPALLTLLPPKTHKMLGWVLFVELFKLVFLFHVFGYYLLVIRG